MITITIDEKQIQTEEGRYILDIALENGIDIPHLCYAKDLEIVSSCRLCLVEIEGSRKLKTACSTIAKDGMVVRTKTERLINHRKNVLQLLLDSHPNDCLTCQKAGECELQKYSYQYGVKFRDHDGVKREKIMDLSSPYIARDDSKCILCGKCVRTCDVLEERKILNFQNRGYDTKITLDLNDSFESSYCVSCNRCVSVCPVGALVDRRSLGKGRTWELDHKTVQCKVCEYGCEFDVLSKNGKNVAVKAKQPANGRPLCLKGRLTTELTYLDRPERPYKKVDGEFVESDWEDVLGIKKTIEKIQKLDRELDLKED
ncbi:MAG: 2Fe-2S iron-sulfur cluster-binding protein [Finegoldia sp.]|nr:2Fe-2S iron-sulfur cluster-binding protein [Finegoldia sp.]